MSQPSLAVRLMNRVWNNGILFIKNDDKGTYGERCKECGAVAQVELETAHQYLPKGHKMDCLVGEVEDILIASIKATDAIMKALEEGE